MYHQYAPSRIAYQGLRTSELWPTGVAGWEPAQLLCSTGEFCWVNTTPVHRYRTNGAFQKVVGEKPVGSVSWALATSKPFRWISLLHQTVEISERSLYIYGCGCEYMRGLCSFTHKKIRITKTARSKAWLTVWLSILSQNACTALEKKAPYP